MKCFKFFCYGYTNRFMRFRHNSHEKMKAKSANCRLDSAPSFVYNEKE